MYSELDDTRLMALIQSGNHTAFAELVQRHTDRFYALAYRTLQQANEAEDAVQTAFLKLWQKPGLWQSDKGAQFTTWFYRVVLNHCHDLQRKAKPISYQDFELISQHVESNEAFKTNDAERSPSDQLEKAQEQQWRQNCLESAIAQLPSSQKDALNLVVYGELSQQQAADVLDVSIKALESLLFRARRAVKQHCETLNLKRYSRNNATKQQQKSQFGGLKS